MRPRAAEIVEVLGEVVERLRDAVPVAELVHGAVQAALGCRPVVAGDVDDERVVEVAGFVDGLDDAADLMIRVFDRAAEDLHPPGADALVGFSQLLPRRDPLGPGLEPRVARNDPELLLAGQDAVAEYVVAVVEPASIPLAPLTRDTDRRLVGTRCVVRDPRLVRVDRPLSLDPADGLVGHVGLEVVPLLRGLRRPHRGRVLPQGRIPLAHAGTEEAIEVLGTPCRSASGRTVRRTWSRRSGCCGTCRPRQCHSRSAEGSRASWRHCAG